MNKGAELSQYLDVAGKDLIILGGVLALTSIIGRIYQRNRK